MNRRRGHPVLGAVAGFFFGLFVAADLWLFGVVPSDSVLLTILPPIGLLLGLAVGLAGPFRRHPPPRIEPPAPTAA